MALPLEKVIYSTTTHVTGGRDGSGRSGDGALDVKLDHFASGKGGTNPEQLFGVGYSACFLSAIGIAAKSLDVQLSPDTSVDARVDLGATARGEYQLAVKLDVNIPGVDADTRRKLVEIAHQTCPYSRMTRGEVLVEVGSK